MSSTISEQEILPKKNVDPQDPKQPEVENTKAEEEPVKDDPENNPLERSYTFWYSIKANEQNYRLSAQNYENVIKKIGTFHTVEDFWGLYQHLVKPDNLPIQADYHLFEEGIKPMWEDENNKHGGRFILWLQKGFGSRFWEELILALIGEQFDVGNEICGIVISTKVKGDTISIWHRNAQDNGAKDKIRAGIRRALNLSEETDIEYKENFTQIMGATKKGPGGYNSYQTGPRPKFNNPPGFGNPNSAPRNLGGNSQGGYHPRTNQK